MNPISTRPRIDLNADLGEGFPWDEALLDRVTSASISCGYHAGDDDSIRETLRAATSRGVVVGAHPGFPDREGFGRRERPISRDEAEGLVLDQLAALALLAEAVGGAIRFVKPHGALYNQAQRDPEIASGIVAACRSLGLMVLGLPGQAVEAACARESVRFIAEGFADRAYLPDGRLVPRDQPGAVLMPEAMAPQVLRLVARGLDTICLHGDDPRSVATADHARSVLDRNGIAVGSFAR